MLVLGLLLAQFITLSLAAEVCYPPCGCFSNDAPFDDRDLPSSPEDQRLRWLLYTKSNKYLGVFMTPDNIPPQYNPANPTKFLIHGWNSDVTSMNEIKNAFFVDRDFDYNVIMVDWAVGAAELWYPLSASNTRVVGACTGDFANTLVSLGANINDMHCIGHSLGAHTCGYMGKHLRGALGRITGTDPAGPWFDTTDNRVRMDASDCRFMDVIHTNGDGFLTIGLGRPIGHVDFFPNKASNQPACGDDPLCGHSISKTYFTESIRSECQFSAFPCRTESDADNGQCETCSEGVDCQRMGYFSASQPGRGTYFLRTTTEAPYCVD